MKHTQGKIIGCVRQLRNHRIAFTVELQNYKTVLCVASGHLAGKCLFELREDTYTKIWGDFHFMEHEEGLLIVMGYEPKKDFWT